MSPRASPRVRAWARHLGVDLAWVAGGGRGGRIRREDVSAHVKRALESGLVPGRSPPSPPPASTLSLLPWPEVRASAFGPCDTAPRSTLARDVAAGWARDRALIPAVTSFDVADVTALMDFLGPGAEAGDGWLGWVLRAVAEVLGRFPEFNAALDGQDPPALILRREIHFLVETDHTPPRCIPQAQTLGPTALAAALGAAGEPEGGALEVGAASFTVQHLPMQADKPFSPAIRAPAVATLGLGAVICRPHWEDGRWGPRWHLPLALTWDHRAVDGGAAAHWLVALADALGNPRALCP